VILILEKVGTEYQKRVSLHLILEHEGNLSLMWKAR